MFEVFEVTPAKKLIKQSCAHAIYIQCSASHFRFSDLNFKQGEKNKSKKKVFRLFVSKINTNAKKESFTHFVKHRPWLMEGSGQFCFLHAACLANLFLVFPCAPEDSRKRSVSG